MSEGSGRAAAKAGRRRPLGRVVGVFTPMILVVLVASPGTTDANTERYSIVARLDGNSARPTPGEVVLRIGNASAQVTAIQASPEIPRNIAIVIDAGPNQVNVLSREEELAIALIHELSDASTAFSIARAGISSSTQAATLDRSVAIQQIREITGDSGKKMNVAIYDALGSSIRQISLAPSLRVVIFIGEGNDGGSSLRFAELRRLAESNQIAFCAALVADHSLRGTKSILQYGWSLQELSSDTVGVFLENQKTPKATRRLGEGVQRLGLVTFEMPSRPSGRYKVSVSSKGIERLKVQKDIVIP
jgi:hypothetical protein